MFKGNGSINNLILTTALFTLSLELEMSFRISFFLCNVEPLNSSNLDCSLYLSVDATNRVVHSVVAKQENRKGKKRAVNWVD